MNEKTSSEKLEADQRVRSDASFSALVCYTCKTRFDVPQDVEGREPDVHEDIVCPGCGERHMRIFYHEIREPNEQAETPPKTLNPIEL